MKTYLITGGAGFIGSHLADYLIKSNYNVIVIDNFNNYYDPKIKEDNVKNNLGNSKYKLERVDIRDLENVDRIFSENNIDVVIHLAAMAGVRPSIENPVLYQEVNGLGTQNILEAMAKHNIKKLVSASSSSVYGNNKNIPFSETDIVDYAISPYAATKKANEVMGHVYHSLYGISMGFLRFFTVYGPRQRPDLAINKFTRLMLNDEEVPLYGDGTTARDYTYIDDIIGGIVKTINWVENNEHSYEIFNLGNSSPVTLNDMVRSIEAALNMKAKIKRLPMQPGDVDMTYANIEKARRILEYNPSTSFEDGIRKFVDWYVEYNKENKSIMRK